MNHSSLDSHDGDAPIFAADAFRLGDEEAALINKARRFGARVLSVRAAQHDRDATFPIENFRDMHPEGLLRICIPKEHGGLGASFRTYCLAAAELGRYCGATALSWNMHVCSTLWTGTLADDLEMSTAEREAHNAARGTHYRRIGGRGCVRDRGKARRWRLHRQRQEDLRLALGRRGLLRHSLHRARGR